MPVATAKELRSKELDPLFKDPAVGRALDMMNLDPYLTQDNILLWIEAVGEIESSGGKKTSNKERVGEGGTSAKGNYQFTDETYRSYLQSTVNAYRKTKTAVPEWVTEELKNPNRDPRSLSDYQQRVLLMVGTHARAKDADMQKAWGEGDLLGAGKKIFYQAHYAGTPNRPTIRVVNREFGKIEDRIITLAPEEPDVPGTDFEPRIESELASTLYAAYYPNEVDRQKLKETLQEVRTDVQRVLAPVIPTKSEQVPVPEPKVELDPVEQYLNRIVTPERVERPPRSAEEQLLDMAGDRPMPVVGQRAPIESVSVTAPRPPAVSVDNTFDSTIAAPNISMPRLPPAPPPQPELTPVNVPSRAPVAIPPTSEPRLESELAATQMAAMQPRVPAEVTVPQRAGRFPEVKVQAKRVSEEQLEVVPGVDPVQRYLNRAISTDPAVVAEPPTQLDPVNTYLKAVKDRQERERIGFIREVAGGLTLQFSEELEALMSDEPYEVAVERIRKEREQYQFMNPRASFYGEIAGGAATSVGVISGLRALGVTSGSVAGALEFGAYGMGSGEGVEDKLIKGSYYSAGGAVAGRIFDSIFDPNLGRQVKSVDELNAQKADLQEQLLQEVKVERPTAEITNDELATQLLLRETEYLGDVIGRQGVLPSDLGSMLTRMRTYAEDMGVNMSQFNKVYNSNKEIKALRDTINQKFDSLEELSLLRQDLLDQTTGRLVSDTNTTIPQAQSTILKLRRLASPTATLAEETVGKSFAARIIRGMNRVTRGQHVLDKMWKGMEPFRELAQSNIKFNDALLDVMNSRLKQEFREARLKSAINIAKKEIGEGAEERLNKFFDDNLEFSSRYRREVTAGDLSRLWMHSNLMSTAQDSSLRTFRQRAAAKAEDAASKDIQRPSMKKWRKKNAGNDKDYENIFDSHWRWQRQTLTRLELGKQLGFRTAGKPVVAQGKKTLEETAAKEAGSFKLFDDRIIKEALEREGLSEVQIQNAIEIIDDLGINANKGMAHELEMIRSLGYIGTIANPYGALMNVHDLFNASFELGTRNVIASLFGKDGIRFSVSDMGLARQVFGDFVRKSRKGTDQKLLGEKFSGNKFLENAAQASESLLEWSMKWSGFAKLDQFGKSRIMGASFRRARQDINSGAFDNKWQYSFSRGELDQVKRDILAGNTNSELVRDLVMFDLFKLQPINAAAQTAFGLANPNARLFYMLKGFAIKQFDLMERRIFKEWKEGNKRQALQNAMRYMVLSGGGYGIVNEGRQVIKGDVPDPEQAAIGALYQVGSVLTFGAMGANDYGYDKFMSNPLQAIATNLLPPVTATFPAAVIEDTADVARAVLAGETPNPIPDDSIYALPIVGKVLEGALKE